MNTKIIEWAEKYLASNSYIINTSENVQTMPWSMVHRFSTSRGYIYLKQTPPELSLEADVTQILNNKFNANVPVIIATNKDLRCFLMLDAGHRLRNILKDCFNQSLLCQALDKYSYIQKVSIPEINLFLDIGLPDWRLDKLPVLYNDLVSKAQLLKSDGLTDLELKQLCNLHNKFETTCDLLNYYKIPATLDHCDFHDGNVLVDDANITIIDWGETVITHPFFSLISFLNNIAHGYNLKDKDDKYIQLENACFANWANHHKLDEIINIAKKLQPIYRALSYYRLKISSDTEQFATWHEGYGCIARPLREFIANNT
ncbi:MAG: phosphotransferase [Rickettsiaceae bacterium]|nr:phosphotransferase [Rickettsiaceae bacterium]